MISTINLKEKNQIIDLLSIICTEENPFILMEEIKSSLKIKQSLLNQCLDDLIKEKIICAIPSIEEDEDSDLLFSLSLKGIKDKSESKIIPPLKKLNSLLQSKMIIKKGDKINDSKVIGKNMNHHYNYLPASQ